LVGHVHAARRSLELYEQRHSATGTEPDDTLDWTDLTYLLHQHGVSWGYYLSAGTEPDCEDDAAVCTSHPQYPSIPGYWNPLPDFTTVQQDGQVGDIQLVANFLAAARDGTLPAVSWIIPNGDVSEHPPALISVGQRYVTTLVNAPDVRENAPRLGNLLRDFRFTRTPRRPLVLPTSGALGPTFAERGR
jgi:phospholipase C